MDQITTIGLDLAKSVFHVVGFTDRGNEKMKKALRRKQVLAFFARLPPCTIGMEACASSHYWARELKQLGHRVRLIPAQHVKAFLRGNKNDYNDARAIAEALSRPAMRFVKVKSVEEQDIQALHRLRQGAVAERTALCNRLRGLLAEYGLVVPRGVGVLRRRIPEWHSTGGKQVLPGISKHGNKYLRSLLVHGARSALRASANKDDRLSRWVNRVRAERGENKAPGAKQTTGGSTIRRGNLPTIAKTL